MRAANNWLNLYFEKRKKEKGNYHEERLEDDEIVEMAFTFLNLYGTEKLFKFLYSWRPPEIIFTIVKVLVRRLIDRGKFNEVDNILEHGNQNNSIRYQYFILAVSDELLKVGRFPQKEYLQLCLILITRSRTRIPKPDYHYTRGDTIDKAIISFAEVCAFRNLSKDKILRLLKHYIPHKAPRIITSNFQREDRTTYLRALALRCILSNTLDPNFEEFSFRRINSGRKKTKV